MLKIPNTTVELNKFGTHYTITPNEGYVLHDKAYDEPEVDESSFMPTGKILPGYRDTQASIHINNDLSERVCVDENGNEVTGYTEREFYTKLREIDE